MTWWNVGGIAVSAAGSYLNRDEGKARFTSADFAPVNAETPYGSATWSDDEGTISYSGGNQLQDALINQSGQQSLLGTQWLPGYQNPSAGARTAGYQAGNNLSNFFGDYLGASNQLPQFSYNPSMYNQVNQGIGGAIGQYGSSASLADMRNLGLTGLSGGVGAGLYAGGGGSIGQKFNEFQGLSTNLTDILREQARPQQERFLDRTASSLFNSGRLGATGGANLYGEALDTVGRQDLGFQQAGMQQAQQLQNQFNVQQDVTRRTGLAGIGQSIDYGTGAAGTFGSFLGMGQNFENQLFGRGAGINELQNERALGRFTNARELFGFANDIDTMNFEKLLGTLSAQAQQFTGIRDLLRVGIEGANARTQQPVPAGEKGSSIGGDILSTIGGMF